MMASNESVRRAGQALRITEIRFNQAVARVSPMPADVPFLDLSGVEGVEVIDDRDVGAVGQERINDVAADETGTACDQYVHGGR